MQKSKIEWTDYTINPVKGLCPMACSYCYARRMYKNPYYKAMYKNQEIRFDQTVFFNLPRKPSKIFVGSTMELFGEWVKHEWMQTILTICRQHSEHTFIFLTKQPQNLQKWSPFPDNCWVGVSATDNDMAFMAVGYLRLIEAKVKFISFEPLLAPIIRWVGDAEYLFKYLNWVIIGQQTPVKMSTMPKLGWVEEIVNAADKAKISVFEKNNLISLLKRPLRQEFPYSH